MESLHQTIQKMIKSEYARQALKDDLKIESELGVNPYKSCLVAGTNMHTGL